MILALLAEKSGTLKELVDIIYKGKVESGDPRYRAAMHNTSEHLKKLMSEGKVEEKEGEYVKK